MQIHPIFHSSLLEPASPRAQLNKSTELEDEKEYKVEKTLDHRGEGPLTEYLIKWKDCEDDENTWEPLGNLTNAQAMLDANPSTSLDGYVSNPNQIPNISGLLSRPTHQERKSLFLSFFTMDKKQTSPELSQAELPPTQVEQVPANPPSRKRQLDSDDDAEPRARTTRPTSEPARLTRKNLALFDKMSNSKKTSTHRDSDNSSTPYTPRQRRLVSPSRPRENGILDPLDARPPKNLEDIRKRLAESRVTPSSPESEYGDYVHIVGEASSEATMVGEMLLLLKKYPNGYKRALNQAFTAFPRDVSFNNGLPAPQPDYVEGLGIEEHCPLPVNKYVNGAVLFKGNPCSITLLHLAGE
jgi:hypothetical protein